MVRMRQAVYPKYQQVTLPHRASSGVAEAGISNEFSEISKRVLIALAFEFDGVIPHRELRALMREAEAAALETSSPLLVLPSLAEERVLAAVGWHRRQQGIRDRSVLTLAA